MPYSIRSMTMDDYEKAYLLWERTEGTSLHDTDSREGMERFLDRNPGLSSVALHREEIIGAILWGHDGRRGYLHHLAVERAFRNHGLGTELVGRSAENLRRTIPVSYSGNPSGSGYLSISAGCRNSWTEPDSGPV